MNTPKLELEQVLHKAFDRCHDLSMSTSYAIPEDAMQHHLDRLLKARASPKTICPSEVARALSKSEIQDLDATDWRDTMPAIRERVWKMRDQGRVEILQKGEVLSNDVGPDEVRGPIRVRLRNDNQDDIDQ